MIRDDENLQSLEEVVRIAQALACAQEADITRMRSGGFDVKHAEALLSAYREALRLAREHHRRLMEQSSGQVGNFKNFISGK
jgi:hypothetical protein